MSKKSRLPEFCAAKLPSTGDTILIERGESGYRPMAGNPDMDALNKGFKCSIAQREAMFCGSMFGWNVPGADPRSYNSDGTFNRDGYEAAKGAS